MKLQTASMLSRGCLSVSLTREPGYQLTATKLFVKHCFHCFAAFQSGVLQAHVRKVAQCLLDVEGNSQVSHSALAEIHRLSVELTAVLICFSMGSPSNNGIIHSLNMENGTLFQEPPPDSNPDELLVRHISAILLVILCHLQLALPCVKQVVIQEQVCQVQHDFLEPTLQSCQLIAFV